MKLKPFKDLIAMSKEKIDEMMIPIRAKQMKAAADVETSKLDADILMLEMKIQEMCADKALNFTKLLDEMDKLALMERRRDQFGVVLGQLFPVKEK